MAGVAPLSFKNPPVIETVLGVQFDPINGLTNAHLGAFWHALGEEWARVDDAPKLDPVYESFGGEQSWAGLGNMLQPANDPASRLQIRHSDDNGLIQVQNGRLLYNWLGEGGNDYPRYKNVRPQFDRVWGTFTRFLDEHKLDTPRPNQWEATYVNHIEQGTVWEEPLDWVKILPGLGGPVAKPRTVELESISSEWHFEIAPKRGRLHVRLSNGHRTVPDACELLRLDLTARGPVGTGNHGLNVDEGLNLAHEVIVQTFVDITSAEAQTYWDTNDG